MSSSRSSAAVYGRERDDVVFPRPSEGRVGEFVEERVRLSIGDAVALLDHRVPDGLR